MTTRPGWFALLLAFCVAYADARPVPHDGTLLGYAATLEPGEPERVTNARDEVDATRRRIELLERRAAGLAVPEHDHATIRRTLPAESHPTTRDALAAEYAALGARLSRLGQREDSAWAYGQALQNAPQRADWWFDVGVELSVLRRDAEAETAFARAVAEGADPAQTHVVAFHLLASGQYVAAIELIEAMLATDTARGDAYFAVYGLVATTAVRGDVRAFAERALVGDDLSQWPDALAAHLAGRIGEAVLVEVVAEHDSLDRLCEALYFRGLVLELAGDVRGAVAHYRAALDTRVVDFLEYDGAERGLARLRAARGR